MEFKMPEYFYREFRVCYEIRAKHNSHVFFEASGYVQSLTNIGTTNQLINFSTEFATAEGAIREIKKIMEDYIDFEWEQFYRIQDSY